MFTFSFTTARKKKLQKKPNLVLKHQQKVIYTSSGFLFGLKVAERKVAEVSNQ